MDVNGLYGVRISKSFKPEESGVTPSAPTLARDHLVGRRHDIVLPNERILPYQGSCTFLIFFSFAPPRCSLPLVARTLLYAQKLDRARYDASGGSFGISGRAEPPERQQVI